MTKRQTKAAKNEAALKAAGLWDYWMGSASQSYINKIESGDFKVIVAGEAAEKVEGQS